jgi:hypothetical protein
MILYDVIDKYYYTMCTRQALTCQDKNLHSGLTVLLKLDNI